MDFDINGGRANVQGARPYVIFATPSLSHSVSLEFFRSYLETQAALDAAGILHGCAQLGGCPFIDKARNQLVTDFLVSHPDATDLFFIDDDLGWPAQAVVRMLARDEEIVAGMYPHKLGTVSFPGELDFAGEALTEANGLFRALHVPAGFMRIKRRALEAMADRCGTYTDDHNGVLREHFRVFEMGVAADNKYTGEDYWFCRKWREGGGTIWVDPDIAFTHSGRHRFSGSLAATLRNWIESQAAKEAA